MPEVNENEWMTAVTLQKSAGLSLTYENLPKTDQFWTVVNEEIEKLTLDPIDITSREMVFDITISLRRTWFSPCPNGRLRTPVYKP